MIQELLSNFRFSFQKYNSIIGNWLHQFESETSIRVQKGRQIEISVFVEYPKNRKSLLLQSHLLYKNKEIREVRKHDQMLISSGNPPIKSLT